MAEHEDARTRFADDPYSDEQLANYLTAYCGNDPKSQFHAAVHEAAKRLRAARTTPVADSEPVDCDATDEELRDWEEENELSGFCIDDLRKLAATSPCAHLLINYRKAYAKLAFSSEGWHTCEESNECRVCDQQPKPREYIVNTVRHEGEGYLRAAERTEANKSTLCTVHAREVMPTHSAGAGADADKGGVK